MRSDESTSIWFFIGISLLFNGVLILEAGTLLDVHTADSSGSSLPFARRNLVGRASSRRWLGLLYSLRTLPRLISPGTPYNSAGHTRDSSKLAAGPHVA